jgi:hypothetical protein
MSFDLLPGLPAFMFVVYVVAALGVTLTVAALTVELVQHRGIRLARRESIPTYYRHLALAH